ncbi:MAG: hypothetical protein M3334_13080 [Actinomycetota bacterium]|nr:hypothetical protein [Actinomycetota bacterium]
MGLGYPVVFRELRSRTLERNFAWHRKGIGPYAPSTRDPREEQQILRAREEEERERWPASRIRRVGTSRRR